MKFEDLKSMYSSKAPNCCTGRLGYTYLMDQHVFLDNNCRRFSCKKCRPKLKYELFLNILREVYEMDLNYHFIVTCLGSEFRKEVSFLDSYKVLNKEWNKYRFVLEYYYPGSSFILLPRAQSDPTNDNPIGYCHYHILTNNYFDWGFLEEKRKKYRIGFNFIRENRSVAEYLNSDFFTDDEWIIPLGVRHYRSSRDISLSVKYCNRYAVHVESGKSLEDKEKICEELVGYPAPLEEYLKVFVK